MLSLIARLFGTEKVQPARPAAMAVESLEGREMFSLSFAAPTYSVSLYAGGGVPGISGGGVPGISVSPYAGGGVPGIR